MDDNKPEPKWIVGSPQANVQGSTSFPCTDCQADVWLARSGQRQVREHGAKPLCMQCMVKRLEGEQAPTVEIPSKATILEDLGFLNRN